MLRASSKKHPWCAMILGKSRRRPSAPGELGCCPCRNVQQIHPFWERDACPGLVLLLGRTLVCDADRSSHAGAPKEGISSKISMPAYERARILPYPGETCSLNVKLGNSRSPWGIFYQGFCMPWHDLFGASPAHTIRPVFGKVALRRSELAGAVQE